MKNKFEYMAELANLRWLALKIASISPVIKESCAVNIEYLSSFEFEELQFVNHCCVCWRKIVYRINMIVGIVKLCVFFAATLAM